MSGSTEAAKLARELRRLGYTVEITRKNHYKVLDPAGQFRGMFAGSPSSQDFFKKTVCKLRRNGVELGRGEE